MSIKLHGKEYIEVKDRVAEAHAEESFSMLKEESFELGGRAYVQVTIEVKGHMYIGTAEIKFNANPKTPDGMSPYECGETSALGRALGFAGYGAVESIASADEVVRNQEPAPQPKQALQTVPVQPHAQDAQPETPSVKDLQKRCNALFGVGYWQAMTLKALKVENMDIVLKDSDLTADDRLAIQKYMDFAEARNAKAS